MARFQSVRFFRARGFRGFRGFTLIEVLVTIAIIITLIGILVPVLSSARDRGRQVASRAQLNGISAAIESYASTLNTYPGYFDDATLETNNTNFTSTENLVLSLMGGVTTSLSESGQDRTITVNGKDHKLFYTRIGSGPTPASGRKMDAFYSAKPEELHALTDGSSQAMPEFVDATTGMPILYYRVSARGQKPVSQLPGDNPMGKIHLDLNELYLDKTLTSQTNDGYDQTLSLLTPSRTNAINNLAWIVTSPKLSDVPLTTPASTDANDDNPDIIAGKYVLIAPGPDGIYFNADDNNGADITDYKQLGSFDDIVHIGGQ